MTDAADSGTLPNVLSETVRLLSAAGHVGRPEAGKGANGTIKRGTNAAICVTGIAPDGPVRWDIVLEPRMSDLN